MCAIVHTLVCTKTHLGVLSNTPVFRVRDDYEQLCRLDVLGLYDNATGDQQNVYSEFKEQLSQSKEGWNETSLP